MPRMKQYLSYPVFAIDYDDTIVDSNWPGAGSVKEGALETINWFKKCGVYIIIWSCREMKSDKDAAKSVLKKSGIIYDKFNENCPELIDKFHADSRKIGADLYIEDKTLLVGSLSWPVIKALATEAFDLTVRNENEL